MLAGCANADQEPEDDLLQLARSTFGTLETAPAELRESPQAVLGHDLFWDERISYDGETSCASCHTREAWGADERRYSITARGTPTGRNSLTVLNAMRQPTLRWVGDHEDGAEQATALITAVMGLDDTEDVVPLLLEHGYEDAFRNAFPEDPEPVSPENYGRALRVYQNTLVTPSPFDAYLAGDPEALSAAATEGLELFLSTGCSGCHAGELLGGRSFQRFGIVEDYWIATGSEEIDEGRYAVTEDPEDRYVFRTPMLRNVARTSPYFHDGSVAQLDDAVAIMARVQLGRTLASSEVEGIVTFLESLTGPLPENFERR